MRLTLEDCIHAGFCVKGQIAFCKAHGFNYRKFVREGAAFEDLRGIDDANLHRAMLKAEERTREDQRG